MCQKIWAGVSPSLPIPKLTQYIRFLRCGQNWAGPPPPLIWIKSKRTATFFRETVPNRGGISVFPRANFLTDLWEPLKHTSPPFHASWDNHRIHQYHPCTWGNRGNQGGRQRARSSQFGNIGKALPWLGENYNLSCDRMYYQSSPIRSSCSVQGAPGLPGSYGAPRTRGRRRRSGRSISPRFSILDRLLGQDTQIAARRPSSPSSGLYDGTQVFLVVLAHILYCQN